MPASATQWTDDCCLIEPELVTCGTTMTMVDQRTYRSMGQRVPG